MFGVNINARGRGRMGRGGGRGGRGGRGGGDRGNGLDENLITRVEENDVDTEVFIFHQPPLLIFLHSNHFWFRMITAD